MGLHIPFASGSASAPLDASDAVFGREFSEALVHQAVVAYLAGGRAGTKAQKGRSEVSGGGSKPWRQKGTGRARAGTTRGPLWRTGGVTFAAKPRSYAQKLNRKMYRGAMCSILSELLRQGRLVAGEGIALEQPKTKQLVEKLKHLGTGPGRTLIVTEEVDENLYLAARNLPRVSVCIPSALNPVLLVDSEHVVVTPQALKAIEEQFK